jgi:hypothetical protein
MTPCDRSWPEGNLLGERKVFSKVTKPTTPTLINPKKTSYINSPNTLIVQRSVLPYSCSFNSKAIDSLPNTGEYTYWRGDTRNGYYTASKIEGSEAHAEEMAKSLVADPTEWNWSLASVQWYYPVQLQTFPAYMIH